MDVSSQPRGSGRADRPSAATRSRAATRARLIEAARGLFATEGLHGVTTHDIAGAAGVAAGTFYLHFKDKREVFREITETAVAQLKQRLDEAVPKDRDLETHVRMQSTSLVDFALENRELMRICFSSDGDAAAVESDLLDSMAGWVAEGRRDAIARGEIPDDLEPEVLSQAIVGMWARVLKWWIDDPERVSRETVIQTLTRIQLGGTESPRPD